MLKDCVCGKEIYMEIDQKTKCVVILDSTPDEKGTYQKYLSEFGSIVAPAGKGFGEPREKYKLHPASLESGIIRCSERR